MTKITQDHLARIAIVAVILGGVVVQTLRALHLF